LSAKLEANRKLNRININNVIIDDSLCGLVVIVPGYRSRGPVSIPGITRFSEK
jgi:hypothetical protein